MPPRNSFSGISREGLKPGGDVWLGQVALDRLENLKRRIETESAATAYKPRQRMSCESQEKD